MPFDPIALIEKGYEPRPSPEAWLRALTLEVTAAIDPEGYGGLAYFYTEAGIEDFTWCPRPGTPFDEETVKRVTFDGFSAGTPEQLALFRQALTRPGIGSLTEVIGDLPEAGRGQSPIPIADSPGIAVHTAERRVALFGTFTPQRASFDEQTRALWQRLTVHLGAGCRLAGRPAAAEAEDVEAVLTPDGKMAHGEAEASTPQSRADLAEAVKQIDRARRRAGRADPMQALELWQGLLAGRWSLVDHFDSDGRRFLLARRNDPDVPAPTALTRRQRQVVFYASLGWSLKEVGYALGLSESSVNAHLRKAMTKLGIPTRADLVRIGSEICAAGAATPAPSDGGAAQD